MTLPGRRRLPLVLVIPAPILALMLTLAVLWLFPGSLNVGQPEIPDSLSPREKPLLREGDVILMRGTGYTGDLIIVALNEKVGLSHCGMVVGETGGPRVIHTISAGLSGSDGVRSQPLDEFTAKSRPGSIIVVRPRWRESAADGRGGAAAATRARVYLERKVPFDNVFDFGEREKMYCTELLYQSLADTGFWDERPAPELTGGVLGFNVFLDPASFTVILNHQQAAPAD